MRAVLWLMPFFGALIGGLWFVATLIYADSAPQQGAGAAIAIAWAVLPYCFARALEKMAQEPLGDALAKAIERLAEAQREVQPPPRPARKLLRPTPASPALDAKIRSGWE